MPLNLRRKSTAVLPATSGDSLFEDVALTTNPTRSFTEIYGTTGSGRTRLALTAPPPIALIHTGEKVGPIARRFRQEKDIRWVNVGFVPEGTPQQRASAARQYLDKARRAIEEAKGWARSIVIDTHKGLYECVMFAELFGSIDARERQRVMAKDHKEKSAGQLDFGKVNLAFKPLLMHYRQQSEDADGYNLIVIAPETDEYKKRGGEDRAKRTGRQVADGQKDVKYMVDVRLRTYCGEGPLVKYKYGVEIVKAWDNPEVKGDEYFDDDITFPYLMSLITETQEEEWEV